MLWPRTDKPTEAEHRPLVHEICGWPDASCFMFARQHDQWDAEHEKLVAHFQQPVPPESQGEGQEPELRGYDLLKKIMDDRDAASPPAEARWRLITEDYRPAIARGLSPNREVIMLEKVPDYLNALEAAARPDRFDHRLLGQLPFSDEVHPTGRDGTCPDCYSKGYDDALEHGEDAARPGSEPVHDFVQQAMAAFDGLMDFRGTETRGQALQDGRPDCERLVGHDAESTANSPP